MFTYCLRATDSCSAVRDAAIECLEEVYKVLGEQLVDIIGGHNLRPAHLREIYSRISDLGPLPPSACLSDRGTPLPPPSVGGESVELEGPHDAGYSSRTTGHDQGGPAALGTTAAAGSRRQGAQEVLDTYEIVDAKSYTAGPTHRRGGYKVRVWMLLRHCTCCKSFGPAIDDTQWLSNIKHVDHALLHILEPWQGRLAGQSVGLLKDTLPRLANN
jgi:hypothetical protein